MGVSIQVPVSKSAITFILKISKEAVPETAVFPVANMLTFSYVSRAVPCDINGVNQQTQYVINLFKCIFL